MSSTSLKVFQIMKCPLYSEQIMKDPIENVRTPYKKLLAIARE